MHGSRRITRHRAVPQVLPDRVVINDRPSRWAELLSRILILTVYTS